MPAASRQSHLVSDKSLPVGRMAGCSPLGKLFRVRCSVSRPVTTRTTVALRPSRAAACLDSSLGGDFVGKLQCDGCRAYPAFAKGNSGLDRPAAVIQRLSKTERIRTGRPLLSGRRPGSGRTVEATPVAIPQPTPRPAAPPPGQRINPPASTPSTRG